MRTSLLKMAFRWIFQHKLRYIFCWISFGLISVLLVFGFSFGKNSLDELQESNYYCISIKGDPNMDGTIKKIGEEIHAKNYRAVSDTGMEITSIDKVKFGDYIDEIDYFDTDGALLLNDTEADYYGENVDSLGEYDICVSIRLAKILNIDKEELIGKRICFNAAENEYVIKGVFDTENTVVDEPIAYIPYSDMLNNIPEYGIKRVDFVFEDEAATRKAINFLEGKYEFINNSSDIENKIQLSNAFKKISVIISLFLFVIAGIGLTNISLTILNENKDFLYLLQVLGIRTNQYHILINYLTVIQGVIGAIIGCIISFLIKGCFPKLLKYIMGEYYIDLSFDFNLGVTSILIVFIFNMIISIIVGEIIALIKTKSDFENVGR